MEEGSIQVFFPMQKPKIDLLIADCQPGSLIAGTFLKHFKLKCQHNLTLFTIENYQPDFALKIPSFNKWKIKVVEIILERRDNRMKETQNLAVQKLKGIRERRKKESLLKGMLDLSQRMT